MRQTITRTVRFLTDPRMIMIFPEGGRRWDGRPKPLIEATLKLFWKMRIPVHAVQVHDILTYGILALLELGLVAINAEP